MKSVLSRQAIDAASLKMMPAFEIVFCFLTVSTIAGLLAILALLFREPKVASILACVCIACSVVPAVVLQLNFSGRFSSVAIPSMLGFFALGGCCLFPEIRNFQGYQFSITWLLGLTVLAAAMFACIKWIFIA